MPLSNGALTPREERFCHEYPVDFCGKKAAIRAGYAEKSAHVRASRMLTKPAIKARMAEVVRALCKNADINIERVLREYKGLAYADLREICEWGDGIGVRLFDSWELPDHAAAAVKKIKCRETQTTYHRKDGTEETVVFRETEAEMHGKCTPLDRLAQYLVSLV